MERALIIARFRMGKVFRDPPRSDKKYVHLFDIEYFLRLDREQSSCFLDEQFDASCRKESAAGQSGR